MSLNKRNPSEQRRAKAGVPNPTPAGTPDPKTMTVKSGILRGTADEIMAKLAEVLNEVAGAPVSPGSYRPPVPADMVPPELSVILGDPPQGKPVWHVPDELLPQLMESGLDVATRILRRGFTWGLNDAQQNLTRYDDDRQRYTDFTTTLCGHMLRSIAHYILGEMWHRRTLVPVYHCPGCVLRMMIIVHNEAFDDLWQQAGLNRLDSWETLKVHFHLDSFVRMIYQVTLPDGVSMTGEQPDAHLLGIDTEAADKAGNCYAICQM